MYVLMRDIKAGPKKILHDKFPYNMASFICQLLLMQFIQQVFHNMFCECYMYDLASGS